MGRSILPTGEEIQSTPSEVLRYVNPDNLRQIFRQERLRWNLKVNKDVDYVDNERLFKYASEVHNNGLYQRMEIHTLADNGAYSGYAGINNDSGVFGLVHDIELWDHAMSEESKDTIVNRTLVGAMANIPERRGYGLNEIKNLVDDSPNRVAMELFDPFDGRVYLYSNDSLDYVNNETRNPGNKVPLRTVARIADVPTRNSQLINDLHYIADHDYHHTDNNFTNSNRFVVDNLDDRTFVYPEISKDKNGNYLDNLFMGLNGLPNYGESDGIKSVNTQKEIIPLDPSPIKVYLNKDGILVEQCDDEYQLPVMYIDRLGYLVMNDDYKLKTFRDMMNCHYYITKEGYLMMWYDTLKYKPPLEPGDPWLEGVEAPNSYNANVDYSGLNHVNGYIPGVFRSLEELQKVDLVHQKQMPRVQNKTPGAKRPNNFYILDGQWSPTWYDRTVYKDSYLAQSINPNNMEVYLSEAQPVPYAALDQKEPEFDRSQLYQWRYNRIDVKYKSEDIEIHIVSGGEGYQVNDILSWTFCSDAFTFKVTKIGADGQIEEGKPIPIIGQVYDQDPSTNGLGVEFINISGTGHGAKLSIKATCSIVVNATQIKNNLYAFVDVVPTMESINNSPWSDVNLPDAQGGRVGIRSTAAGPAFSGINSGRGGESPTDDISESTLFEHGGNATAGAHVHLFRYVINTQNPEWIIDNGVQVFLGKWVDNGPLGVERPCDIKALLFSNSDTNNFSNYYKFMVDMMTDTDHRNPDAVITNNPNALSSMYLHIDQKDPEPDQKFTMQTVDPVTTQITERDVTRQVLYINAATGVLFLYNNGYKNDQSSFGYGFRSPGWFAIAGGVAR